MKLEISQADALRKALANREFRSGLEAFCKSESDHLGMNVRRDMMAVPPKTCEATQAAASAKAFDTFIVRLETFLKNQE